MSRIAVVDLGIGNLRSVEQALRHVAPRARVTVSGAAAEIDAADRMVLPGQGAIGSWFAALRAQDVEAAVRNALQTKPCLGICVGQQALFEHSEEDGGVAGLGLFSGRVRHFREFHSPAYNGAERLKIPHMGWNRVEQTHDHPLWSGIESGQRFYFVHSYCANAEDGETVYGETDYGHRFTSVVGRGNIFAVQFHPEKSQDAGLQLLRNFVDWDGQA